MITTTHQKRKQKLSYAQKSCLAKLGKLMYSTSMLRPEARVGVAVSGGKDSWVLLQALLLQRKRLPFNIDLMVLHVNPGFIPDNHLPLNRWLQENKVAGYIEVQDIGPRAHSKENRKNSPCFFCSWRRRKRLFQLVKRFNLTHIALGHNSDDLVENFFMNMFYNGRIEGLYPKVSFFQDTFELIRPLLLVEKRIISKVAKEWDLPVWPNPCPSASSSKRSDMQNILETLCNKDKRIKKNIFSALQRWQMSWY